MLKRNWYQSVLTIVILLGITTLLFLYSAGYRLAKNDDNQQIDFSKTGMIGAKSIPEGASVYLNGVLMTATDDTIAGIEPGMHELKIVRKGFVPWVKQIEVFPELVTDITAVLISQSPRLEPLTNSGAKAPAMSASLNKLAYFSKEAGNSGITILNLNDTRISLFRSDTSGVIKDTPRSIYSDGKSIEWSPDEDMLLVQGVDDSYYLVDINTGTAQTTTSPDAIKKEWDDQLTADRKDFIEKLDIPEEFQSIAISPDAIWSPDEKKFLYTKQEGGQISYVVYNFEKPIPVGEKVENVVFTTNANEPQPQITWYADSFHLVMVEGNVEQDQKGTVSLIRIDGTNKTELYNNTLMADTAYSTPSGDKIIVLTSFKSGDQTDLYTIGIR